MLGLFGIQGLRVSYLNAHLLLFGGMWPYHLTFLCSSMPLRSRSESRNYNKQLALKSGTQVSFSFTFSCGCSLQIRFLGFTGGLPPCFRPHRY